MPEIVREPRRVSPVDINKHDNIADLLAELRKGEEDIILSWFSVMYMADLYRHEISETGAYEQGYKDGYEDGIDDA